MKTVVLISTRLQSHMHHGTLEQWRKNARAYYFVVMYCSRIIHLQTPGVVWVNIDYRNCVFRFLIVSTVDMNLSLMS